MANRKSAIHYLRPGTAAASPTAIASVTVQNTSASTAAAPEVRFAHTFKKGDVPSGSKLSITQNGVAVPHTAARRNTWPDGSLRCADLLCKLPGNIAGSGSATLSLSATTGSFDDALPGGKSVADVVTDITTNFDTIKVQLESLTNSSGGTEGSGTWAADSSTAFGLTSTHGGYRCTATGPAAADFTVWMKLKDGATEHAALWAQWYVTAFLDTSTGAVTKLCWRAWVNQGRRESTNDRYTCTAKLLLNATAVRSWGYAADKRLLNFVPADVITSPVNPPSGINSEITLTGHGFVQGELVRFSTTGALPSGLSAATDYWLRVVDGNTVAVCDNQLSAGLSGSTLTLSSQGSGTHTISGLVCHLRYQRHCLADTTTQHDWHSGTGGALDARPSVHVVHDTTYVRSTKTAPPLDLSVTFADASDPSPAYWAPGTNGKFDTHYGDPGARRDIGGVWNDWACQRFRYPGDRTGYVQTARTHAVAMGCQPFHVVRDDTTFRVPVVNASTYTGLGAALTNSYFYLTAGLKSADFTSATGGQNEYTAVEPAHWSFATYPAYILDGGQDLLDLLYSEASYVVLNKFPDAFAANSWNTRNVVVGGTTYYQILRDSNEPRVDAWALNIMANAVAAGADSDPEHSYFQDVLNDTAYLAAYTWNTLGTASWRAAGGWDLGEVQKLGPGTAQPANMEGATKFMQQYCAMSFAHAYMRLGGSDLQTLANVHAVLQNNYWVNFPCKSFNSSYTIKTKTGPGSSYTEHSPWQDFGLWDDGCDGATFQADGQTLNSSPTGSAQPFDYQDGDRIWFTKSDQYSLDNNAHAAPPTGVNLYQWYYVRQAASNGTINGDPSYKFRISTTNDDLNLVSWTGSASNIHYYVDSFNRSSGCPTTVHRHNGAVGNVIGGYLTLERCANAYLVVAGLLDQSAFDAADALFQQETASGCGPGGFASQNSLFNSAVTSI